MHCSFSIVKYATTPLKQMYPFKDIDVAIDEGIDLLRSDVETVFRQIATEIGPALPYGSQMGTRSRDRLDLKTNKKRQNPFNYIEVSSLRTEGKRVVGKRISIYVAIVASVLIFAYKLRYRWYFIRTADKICYYFGNGFGEKFSMREVLSKISLIQ